MEKNGITKGSSCDFVFRALHGRWEMWAGGQEHFNLNAVYVDKAMTAWMLQKTYSLQ